MGIDWKVKEITVDNNSIPGRTAISMEIEGFEPYRTGFARINSDMFHEIQKRINEALDFERYPIRTTYIPPLHTMGIWKKDTTNLDRFREMSAEELATTLQGFCPENCFTYCTMCESEQDCIGCRKKYFEKEAG